MAAKDEKFKPGTAVQVFSKSDSKWLSGTVKSVEDNLVTVEYEKAGDSGAPKMVKTLTADSDELKPAEAEAKKPATPGALAPPPLEKREDFDRLLLGACLLSAISGMVNAIAILDMSNTVAHHTGNASHFGRKFGVDGFSFLFLMVSYVVGAGSASFGDYDGDAIFKDRNSEGLLVVAGAIGAGTLMKLILGAKLLSLMLWAFSQGLQNGITSRVSGLALRTTHMTGALTDAGLVLGQYAQARYRGTSPPSLRKPILFLSCVGSFAGGGFFVSFLWAVFGVLAAAVPAACLAALASGHVTLTIAMELLLKYSKVAMEATKKHFEVAKETVKKKTS